MNQLLESEDGWNEPGGNNNDLAEEQGFGKRSRPTDLDEVLKTS